MVDFIFSMSFDLTGKELAERLRTMAQAAERTAESQRTRAAERWARQVLEQQPEHLDGLVLMAVDSEEAVFINVLGSLDPMQLSQVMENFDVDIDPNIKIQ